MFKNGMQPGLDFTAWSYGDLISVPTFKECHSVNENSPMLKLPSDL